MAYSVTGLDPAPFADLFKASDAERTTHLSEVVTATSDTGFPCRVSLADAKMGERVLLVHHVSNDVARPFRMAHAIYVRERAEPPPVYRDALPAMLDRRTIGLRAFDGEGMMRQSRPRAAGRGRRRDSRPVRRPRHRLYPRAQCRIRMLPRRGGAVP